MPQHPHCTVQYPGFYDASLSAVNALAILSMPQFHREVVPLPNIVSIIPGFAPADGSPSPYCQWSQAVMNGMISEGHLVFEVLSHCDAV